VVAGHTFKLDNGNELTPFVHPRLVLDDCGSCSGTHAKLDVDVDVGINYEITPQIAVRLSGLLGGTTYGFGATNALGFSVAWTPKGLKK
jgi:hypothetical protein